MTATPPAPKDRPTRRKVWASLLYLAILAAGVFAAWQIHEFRALRRQVELPLPDQPDSAQPASRPGGLLADPLGPSGLAPLAGDPGGLPPPPGARRVSAFQSKALGLLRQQARYELAADAQAVVGHYGQILAERGLPLLRDKTDPAGGRELLWAAGRTTVSLVLRKPSQDEKIGVVILVVCGPVPNESTGR